MRQDFRVKMDISRIYQDARQYSWVFIDSTKIFYVNHLADHVRKLFNVKEPFYFLSRHEDTCFFLPFEEDIRILENNDTVVIIPGTEITTDTASIMKNDIDSSSKVQSNSLEASKDKESDTFSNQSFATDKSISQNNIQNISEIPSFNGTMYRTALHETIVNATKESQVTEENYTEDQSITEESPVTNKRKRVRKRKNKKPTDVIPESDISLNRTSGKKPRIIDSLLITSGTTGKHIRFEGLDDEDIASDATAYECNVQQTLQNGDIKNKQNGDVKNKPNGDLNNKPNGDLKNKLNINNDLTALLSLRQSSTPLTFAHKRIKKEYITESIQEQEISTKVEEPSIQLNTSLNNYKFNTDSERSKTPSHRNDDTVSFKVFRIGEDYTPQLSDVIIANILSTSADGSQYTLKLLHGKEQLKEPEGKFSLPKEENPNENDEIITLQRSELLEFNRIKAIDTPK